LQSNSIYYSLIVRCFSVKDEALIAAATLSDRYIADRKQPDKAIDLIDEACSRLRLEQESKPEAIWKASFTLFIKFYHISLSSLSLNTFRIL